MATPDKVTKVKAMADQFRNASAVYVTEYRGLTVPQMKQLRTGIRGDALSGFAWRSTLAITASAFNGVPSWKLTPSRNFSVQVTLSSVSIDSATYGTTSPFSSMRSRLS